ncbi:MAG: PTS sugar transporter subunit IIB [Clostridium sp.]|nr:PTS sugar transporter subunit IIB [Clostridium sp.]MDU3546405.1 PTS sugar transporter subunit IIB [Clostridium sp.]
MIRIDDRLLHGQVAFAWKAYLGYNTVVIASDNASKDEVKKMALKMCCPSDVRLAIRSVDDALVLLRNPKLDKLKVLVVMDNTLDLLRLCKELSEKPLINLGGMTRREDTMELIKAVNATKDDIKNLDGVINLGYIIECRQVPSDKPISYKKIRK